MMTLRSFPWKLEPPVEFREAYYWARMAGNTERLRIVAYLMFLVFAGLLVQHILSPAVAHESGTFGVYLAIYCILLTGSVLYIFFDRCILKSRSSKAAQWQLVILLLAGTTSLAVIDSVVSGDLSAVLLGLIGVAVLYRCRLIWFVVASILVFTGFILGSFMYGGRIIAAGFLVPLAIEMVTTLFLSLIIGHYDILAFCLQKELKNTLQEKRIILQEVHHRIKNNMGTIYAFLFLQIETMKEPEAIKALEDAGSRIQCMAVLYDKLYRSVDFTELSVKKYLPPLIAQIMESFSTCARIKTEIAIDDFILPVAKLQPLGIIINELITNSMKYAFKEKTEGVIAVSASIAGIHATFMISDDGHGLPESIDLENSTGFGFQLVNSLTLQLNGRIHIERDTGTKVILEFAI